MPWKRLSAWYAEQRHRSDDAPPALTMVTLRLPADADAVDVALHRAAEFNTLIRWAEEGRFVLAFTALDHDELTLLCAEETAAVRAWLQELPLVANGMTQVAAFPVAKLRLTNPLFPAGK